MGSGTGIGTLTPIWGRNFNVSKLNKFYFHLPNTFNFSLYQLCRMLSTNLRKPYDKNCYWLKVIVVVLKKSTNKPVVRSNWVLNSKKSFIIAHLLFTWICAFSSCTRSSTRCMWLHFRREVRYHIVIKLTHWEVYALKGSLDTSQVAHKAGT